MLTHNQMMCQVKVAEVLQLAKSKWPAISGLHITGIKWIKGTTAGKASCKGGYTVMLNLEAAEKYFDDTYNDTVAHEVAHLIVMYLQRNGVLYRVKPHGPEWRRYCIALGGTGKRCHSLQLTASRTHTRYHYVLPINGRVELTKKFHDRIQAGFSVWMRKGKEMVLPQHFDAVYHG